MFVWLVIAGAAVTSLVLTGVMRTYALNAEMLDRPNERSSHIVPTPRGGGVAIVVAITAAWVAVYVTAGFTIGPLPTLTLTALLVAAVGFVDDHRDVPAQWRLLIHLAAAGGLVLASGGLAPIATPFGTVESAWLGTIFAVLYVAWILNLYNFMDGIDGIAGVEAATVAAGAALLLMLDGQPGLAVVVAAIGAAAVGFLVWNWAPAKIFMGDVGSSFLGFVLGGLAIVSHNIGSLDIYAWSILLGVFVVDATIALVRRLARGERVYQAHRSHAYQHAAIRHGSHAIVSAAVGVLNIAWLLPLAALVGTGRIDGTLGLAVAYTPLIWLALRYRSGVDAR
ncbi:MAG: MraY family glycosyltransferase [Gammaproteobacteria bacterium]